MGSLRPDITIHRWNETRHKLAAPMGCFPFRSHRTLAESVGAALPVARLAEDSSQQPRLASGPNSGRPHG